jgi:squalene-associated FAD-dependent desaturase
MSRSLDGGSVAEVPALPAPERELRPRIAVVGGGLAGLAAAVECADRGALVTLYEARSRLGGATFSFQRNGLELDNGQHVALRCCTAYLGFLRRLGVEGLLPLQRRLNVPVLREGRPPASISRTALPPPLHLAATLLRYAPLGLRERLAAARAATALGKLDPDDPALDGRTFADWLLAHGQSENAIEALWNLIALPTLNLPADEASLAGAVKVFRTGLLDRADASDIGVPTAPFRRLHAEPAQRALEAAGGEIKASTPVRSVTAERRVVLDDGSVAADAVILAVPHDAVSEIAPAGAVDAEALTGLGTSPIVNLHVHYDRPVLDGELAAALDSPVQWIFDRTGPSGAKEGQLVAVSLSHAVDDIDSSVAALRERYVPALERLLPAARGAEILDFAVTHEPRATFRAAPGTRTLRPGTRTAVPGVYLAGAWTDTGWPATMESAVRSGLAAADAAMSGLENGRLENGGAR